VVLIIIIIIIIIVIIIRWTMVTGNLARTSSPRPWERSRKLSSMLLLLLPQLLIALGVWTDEATTPSSTTTVEALRLDFGLPGGSRVSYRDGLLRIRPPVPTEPSSSSSSFSTGGPQIFEVPWDQALTIKGSENEQSMIAIKIEIEHRKTPSKGYGAFYAGTEPLRGGSFLGFYEGRLVNSRESLDHLHALQKEDLLSAGMEDDANKVGDYVLSLDGGVHFLDGFDLRYRGNVNNVNNNERQQFTPAHLNHAEKGDPACNVVRTLVYLPDDISLPDTPETNESEKITQTTKAENENNNKPLLWLSHDYPRNLPRVAFFVAREIHTGEELAFDYGTNFWKTDKQ
jgi:hypothetical protein